MKFSLLGTTFCRVAYKCDRRRISRECILAHDPRSHKADNGQQKRKHVIATKRHSCGIKAAYVCGEPHV